MTDNEIIKTVECLCGYSVLRAEYPYADKEHPFCWHNVARDAIDLINRQKVEIEKLKRANRKLERAKENLRREIKAANVCLKQLEVDKKIYKEAFEVAKSEAIKEFAEKVKTKFADISFYRTTRKIYRVEEVEAYTNAIFNTFISEKIDELVKEIMEKEENES